MFQYYLFYKPYQVLTQFTEEGEKQTLAHYFKGLAKDVYPVGRLDYDSEGLLLLTNDKELAHQLMEPQYAHERTYCVQVEGIITQDALKQLEQGVTIAINGKKHVTLPAVAQEWKGAPKVPERNPPIRYRKEIPTSWIGLTITEGKNRQVRRMTAAVGFPTLRLIRFSIGDVAITGLQPGDFAVVGPEVKAQLLRKARK